MDPIDSLLAAASGIRGRLGNYTPPPQFQFAAEILAAAAEGISDRVKCDPDSTPEEETLDAIALLRGAVERRLADLPGVAARRAAFLEALVDPVPEACELRSALFLLRSANHAITCVHAMTTP